MAEGEPGALAVSSGHAVHTDDDCAPTAVENVLGPQSVHSSAASRSENVPAGQPVHPEAWAGDQVPPAQTEQLPARTLEYIPAAQEVQLPLLGLKKPATQAGQAMEERLLGFAFTGYFFSLRAVSLYSAYVAVSNFVFCSSFMHVTRKSRSEH